MEHLLKQGEPAETGSTLSLDSVDLVPLPPDSDLENVCGPKLIAELLGEYQDFSGVVKIPEVTETLSNIRHPLNRELCEKWLNYTGTQGQASLLGVDERPDIDLLLEAAGEALFALEFAELDSPLLDRFLLDRTGERKLDESLQEKCLETAQTKLLKNSTVLHALIKGLSTKEANAFDYRILAGYLRGVYTLAGEIENHGAFRFFASRTARVPEEFQVLYGEEGTLRQTEFLETLLENLNRYIPIKLEPLIKIENQLNAAKLIFEGTSPQAQLTTLLDFINKLCEHNLKIHLEVAQFIVSSLPIGTAWGWNKKNADSYLNMANEMERRGLTKWAASDFEPMDRVVLWHICNAMYSTRDAEALSSFKKSVLSKVPKTHEWLNRTEQFRLEYEILLTKILADKLLPE